MKTLMKLTFGTAMIFILLAVCAAVLPLLGIIWMWAKTGWKKPIKIILTVLVAFFYLVLSVTPAPSEEVPSMTQEVESTEQEVEVSTQSPIVEEIVTTMDDGYTEEEEESVEEEPTLTAGQKNALKQAKNYLRFTAFSYEGLRDQLAFEGYEAEDIQYAIDNCGADWDEQAVLVAQNYLEFTSFSYDGLVDQLEFSKFTHEQAVHGADVAYQ